MNMQYRKKSYFSNVLSFPYGKYEGEIFLNAPCAKREARKFQLPLKARMALLFVHGCFHLKGHAHGAGMEALEQKILQNYGLSRIGKNA